MKFSDFILLILFLVIFSISFYLFKSSFNFEEKNFEAFFKKEPIEVNASSNLVQFVPNMRFSKNNISFFIEEDCSKEKSSRVREAFKILEEETKVIFFYEIKNDSADILVFCSQKEAEKKEGEKKIFILGEGGPRKFLNLTPYPLIIQGEVSLFLKKEEVNCEMPLVELHEILHVFGYDHINDKKSILYPYLNCEQKLTQEVIDDLINLYSQKAKAEISIVNISATKKGNYLNFFIEITNTGLVRAENVSFEIYSEKERINNYSLEYLEPGYSRKFYVENFFLKSPKVKKLLFKVFSEKEEYSINNNEVELFLEE